MYNKINILCICYLIVNCYGSAVSNFKVCKWEDRSCVLESAQNALPIFTLGMPDYKIPPSDPLVLAHIDADEGELKLKFTDTTVMGLSKCKVLDLSLDEAKSRTYLSGECPIVMNGKYEVGGRLLILPVEGSGDYEIQTNKMRFDITMHMKTIDGADGKKYWKISKFENSYDAIERVHYKFDNLFNGDESKAKPVIEILNTSWKEIINSVGSSAIKSIIRKLVESVNKFFASTPIEELKLH